MNIIDNGQVIGTAEVNPDSTWAYTDQPRWQAARPDHHRHRSVGQRTPGRKARVVITVDVGQAGGNHRRDRRHQRRPAACRRARSPTSAANQARRRRAAP
ncbi:hypothetical protein KIF59_23105 [Enterobacter cloacae subsp. cloacae]|nr:hypothetical protein [Enterobacter cloacae subsp. cloacae]